MKLPLLPTMLFAALFMATTLLGANVSPFAAFRGDYLDDGVIKISQTGEKSPSGTAKIRFQIATTGKRAKLKFHATIKLPDADRSLSGTFLFKHKHRAQISNLAPGIDDGHLAEGTYRISARRITAEFPFVVGTSTGKVTLLIRLENHQIFVVQILSASTLEHPITWRFSARSRL